MENWTLALGGSDHDYSAALANDSDIRVAIEQERLTRRKHGLSPWYEDPLQRAIDYCLDAEGISMGDVATIVSSDLLPARVRHRFRRNKFREFPHHLCHAASVYLLLPPGARAGIIVYDGFGSIRSRPADEPYRIARETFSFFLFGPNGHECIGSTTGLGYVEQDDFPTSVTDSIGMLYELVTGILGYDPMDSGKTMGLAAHGEPRYLDVLEQFVTFSDDFSSCFTCAIDDPALPIALERVLKSGQYSFPVKADLAASIQALMNKTLLHCGRILTTQDIEYLCIAGGCALNTVANSFLVENLGREIPVIAAPHSSDAGIGFGALWLERFRGTGVLPTITFNNAPANPAISRPGRAYTRSECREAIGHFYPRVVHDSSTRTAADLARLLAGGSVLGVLQGRSEFGPRALGGRSILADPRSARTRERINRILKHREPFRPLAPVVLQSRYDQYFCDQRCADPFMLKVARARERCFRDAPAVVHADGTARVQVLCENEDPFLVNLLREFEKVTGVGLLINTSFNRKGEPIVESPLDAIDAFLGMGLDGLYLDGDYYRPAASPSV